METVLMNSTSELYEQGIGYAKSNDRTNYRPTS